VKRAASRWRWRSKTLHEQCAACDCRKLHDFKAAGWINTTEAADTIVVSTCNWISWTPRDEFL
jgi:hypothetical protein